MFNAEEFIKRLEIVERKTHHLPEPEIKPKELRNPREYTLAIGENSGRIFEIVEGKNAPQLLPPYSSTDIPIWVHVIEQLPDYKMVSKEQLQVALHELWLTYVKEVGRAPSYGYVSDALPNKLGFK